MALRDTLAAPFVVEPSNGHTHTFVFLHRFPPTTTDDELPAKVLASKRTKSHKTLAAQFPTVRWVFPFAKTGARPYGNLTATDKAAVGLLPSSTPYITQVLLQEARRIGGLQNVILGGQGETAVAAHEAMGSFPEISAVVRNKGELAISEFLNETLRSPLWEDPLVDPKLAGFVAMHGEGREVTRDISAYGVASKLDNTKDTKVNTSIVANTKHRFIRGGFKVTTATWDGRRIDEVAEFLEGLGVYRVVDEKERESKETLAPKDRQKKEDDQDEFEKTARDKYLEELAKDKKENETLITQVRRRIEADKATRQYRLDREREARKAREEAEAKAKEEGKAGSIAGDSQDSIFGGQEVEVSPKRHPAKKRKTKSNGRRLDEFDEKAWEDPRSATGDVSAARMRALGLVQDVAQGETVKEDSKETDVIDG
ncbi:hypothetical protein OQA88_5470 [Cercophora sp. LCS_1]